MKTYLQLSPGRKFTHARIREVNRLAADLDDPDERSIGIHVPQRHRIAILQLAETIGVLAEVTHTSPDVVTLYLTPEEYETFAMAMNVAAMLGVTPRQLVMSRAAWQRVLKAYSEANLDEAMKEITT